MRYIDTGSRDAEQTLGHWLKGLEASPVKHLRLQSGYFTADSLGPLLNTMETILESGQDISAVLGSNGGETRPHDVEILAERSGCPRAATRIAIVSYSHGLFHPKVCHATRDDGSQAAYIGSANLTLQGVNGLNVEAGMVLDSALGDPLEPLAEIAAAIDDWFDGSRDGVSYVRDAEDIASLVERGVLGVARPSRSGSSPTAGRAREGGISLRPLVQYPPVPGAADSPFLQEESDGPPPPEAGDPPIGAAPAGVQGDFAELVSVPRDGFPDYLLFAPVPEEPTVGEEALSGVGLPGAALGLIVQLNNDSVRGFHDGEGTANVSIPVSTVGTLRFGCNQHQRPRAEYQFAMRYVGPGGVHVAELATTNVMVYGHLEGESGHGDIRMLVPRSPTRDILQFAQAQGLRVPVAGDPMILEWPTAEDPFFRATLVDGDAPLFADLADALEAAREAGELVGRGACWLLPEVSPDW